MNKEEIKEEIKSFYTKKYNKKNEEIIKKINELQNILKENITEKRQVIYRPEQAFIMLKSTQNKDQEIMKIITLNKNRFKNVHIITMGDTNQTMVNYRLIAKKVIEDEADAVIMAHNHPSNNYIPSNNDKIETNSLCDFLKKMGVILLDHLIIIDNNFYSFKRHGLI